MRLPMPHSSVTGRCPMTIIQFADDSRNTLLGRRLREAGRHLRALLGLADPDRTGQLGLGRGPGPGASCASASGSASVGPEHGLVPAPDLDGMTERAQRGHHLGTGRVVGGMVRRQEHGLRALPVRPAERHPGVHAEGTCLVRRGGHHLPRAGRDRRRRRPPPAARAARAGGGPPPPPGTRPGRRAGSTVRDRSARLSDCRTSAKSSSGTRSRRSVRRSGPTSRWTIARQTYTEHTAGTRADQFEETVVTELDEALYAPSLVEVTTRRLRAEILSGDLAPGQRIVEEQIRQRFAISRAPLREALRTLANQGLVEHLPRRGTRVTELSAREIDELFALRALLERHAIETTFPLRPDRRGSVRRGPSAPGRHAAGRRRPETNWPRTTPTAPSTARRGAGRQPAARPRPGAHPVAAAAPDGGEPPSRGRGSRHRGRHRAARAAAAGAGVQRPVRILGELEDHGGRQFLGPVDAPPGLAPLPS